MGPGQYFDRDLDHSRLWKNNAALMGIKNKDYRPVSAPDRSQHYKAGVITGSGLMMAGSRASNLTTPGPGQYSPVYESDIRTRSGRIKSRVSRSPNNSFNKSKISHPSSIMGESPSKGLDNSIHNCMIKDGLLVKIVGHNGAHIGPGAYNVPLSTFGKKSFNYKVNLSIQESHEKRSPRKIRRGGAAVSQFYEQDGNRSLMMRRHSFQGVPLKFGTP